MLPASLLSKPSGAVDAIPCEAVRAPDHVEGQRDLVGGAFKDVHEVATGVHEGHDVTRGNAVREGEAPIQDQLVLHAVGADQEAIDRLVVSPPADQDGIGTPIFFSAFWRIAGSPKFASR